MLEFKVIENLKPNKDLTKKGKYAEYERFAKEKLENLQKELQEKELELLK